MQESRPFKIVYHLHQDKGQATAHELTEKSEVSDRTIYRDIDALNSNDADYGAGGVCHVQSEQGR